MIDDSDDCRPREMTGQVDFDSHVSGIVILAADLVHLLPPAESAGRECAVPVGAERIDRMAEALRRGGSRRPRLSEAEADDLATIAGRLRPVFEAVSAGEVDEAAETLNLLMARWDA